MNLEDDKFYNLYLSKAKHSETEEEYRYWMKLADKRELKLQGVTNKPIKP